MEGIPTRGDGIPRGGEIPRARVAYYMVGVVIRSGRVGPKRRPRVLTQALTTSTSIEVRLQALAFLTTLAFDDLRF